jgi:hypothetical protein
VDRRLWDGVRELGLGACGTYALWHAGQQEQYGLLPFLVLYTAGFLVVGALTIFHSTAHPSRPGA